MPVIERSTVIDAPVEKVFAILDDPHRLPQYAPGVSRVEEVQQSEQRLGDTVRTVYSVLGLEFPIKLTTREHARPQRLTSEFEGAMHGTFDWTLQPQDSATRTSMRIAYEVAGAYWARR